MTTLRNTVTEPDGAALDGWLDVAVVGSPFRNATQSEVLGPIKDRPFTGGAWSVDLVPGLYVVTQRRRSGAVHSRWTVQVPDTGSVWLADCLVSVPSTPASMALLGIAATVVDEAGHLQLTYTDGTVVDAGAVTGPGSAPDATPTTKGVLRLAGDLGGTAASPTVPALADKLSTAAAPELIRDTMAATLIAGANVTLTVNDAGDTVTIAAAAAEGIANLTVVGTAPASPAVGTVWINNGVAAPPPDTTPPAVPAGVTATGASGQMTLSWSTVSAGDLDHYEYRTGTSNPPGGSPVAVAAGTTAAVVTGLTNGTLYYGQVRAVDTTGNASAWSTVASATPAASADTTAPTVPTGLTATPGDGQVALSWTASTDAVGVTGYRVYRGGSLIASPAATSYVDTGRTNGTSYSYTVSAVDAAGNASAQSSAVTATPAAAVSSIFPATGKYWEFVAADLALANNAAVSTLANRVSGGAALVSGDGVSGSTAAPTYRTDLRSNPVIAFDGVKDFMGADFGSTSAQPQTRILIGGLQVTGNSASLVGTRIAGANREVLAQAATGGKWNAYSGVNLPHSATTDTGLHFFAVVYNGASSMIYVDGVAVTGNAGTEGANGLRVGAPSSAAGALPAGFSNMVFGEAAAYTKAMTTTELDAIRTSAKAKWADLP